MNIDELGLPKRTTSALKSKGIDTVDGLLSFLPKKYLDLSGPKGISCDESEVSSLFVVVKTVRSNDWGKSGKTPMIMADCQICGYDAMVSVVWFNQSFRMRELSELTGSTVFLAGKCKYSDRYGYQFANPEIFSSDIQDNLRIHPSYPAIRGIAQENLRKNILPKALNYIKNIEETVPSDILKEAGQIPLQLAFTYAHAPQTMEQVNLARNRFLFDQLLSYAVQNENAILNSCPGSIYTIKSLKNYLDAIASLPFQLTDDQRSVLDCLIKEFRSGKRCNAVVQGDVGSGKSIVAYLTMLAFASNGHQSILMAPTSILARQHFDKISEIVEPFGIRVAFAGDKQKAKDRRELLTGLENGDIRILVGTTAVLNKNLLFNSLALIVCDEEQRFGASQKSVVVERTKEGCHYIALSATPIPRTLAMTLYGNVQLFTIHTKPSGRKPVITKVLNDRLTIMRAIAYEVHQHHKVYVVCPMIEESESVMSVDECLKLYQSSFEPVGIRCAAITGKTKKEELSDTMSRFRAEDGDIDVLISTTVIEVGVDVPQATMIVIENADRFGLSQLHQLRGRVGRNGLQSYCLLVNGNTGDRSENRLSILCSTNDGFILANEDLKQRGCGDLLIGTSQSGNNQNVLLAVANPDLYDNCRRFANILLDREDVCPLVQNSLLK